MLGSKRYLFGIIGVLSVASLSCRGGGDDIGTPACAEGVLAVDLRNTSGEAAVLRVYDEVGTLIFEHDFAAGAAQMVRFSLPEEGNYTAQVEGSDLLRLTPETLAATCREEPYSLRIEGSAAPEPEMEQPEPSEPELPRLRWESDEIEQALRNRYEDQIRPQFEFPACYFERNNENVLRHLGEQSFWGFDAVLAKLEANLAYIENFFATNFPTTYESAGGRAIDIRPHPTLADRVSAEGPLLAAYEYWIRPEFRFLNDEIAQGGVILVERFEENEFSARGNPRMRILTLKPSTSNWYGSIRIEQFQLPGADRGFGIEDFDYMVWSNLPDPSLAYQMGFTTRSCHPGKFFTSHRFGTRIGSEIYARYGEWQPSNGVAMDCIQRRLRKALHGQFDFIRRKLMDLNGGDRMSFVAYEGSGSFVVTYEAVYECPSELITGV